MVGNEDLGISLQLQKHLLEELEMPFHFHCLSTVEVDEHAPDVLLDNDCGLRSADQ